MATWNRFDICEAWYLLSHDWGLYDKRAQLDRMGFRASLGVDSVGAGALTRNGLDIFHANDRKFIKVADR